jgi:hypothetical protein
MRSTRKRSRIMWSGMEERSEKFERWRTAVSIVRESNDGGVVLIQSSLIYHPFIYLFIILLINQYHLSLPLPLLSKERKVWPGPQFVERLLAVFSPPSLPLLLTPRLPAWLYSILHVNRYQVISIRIRIVHLVSM